MTKKQYRFNKSQTAYLVAKFNIGQETGQKRDSGVVARPPGGGGGGGGGEDSHI